MSKVNLLNNFLKKFNLNQSSFFLFLQDAPRKYKVYQIPKRTSGTRTIAQPTPELKLYQKYLVAQFEQILPVHSLATAYQCKKSIKDNALIHKNNTYFLKMDFSDFFHSITPKILWESCEKNNLYFDFLDKFWIERIVFWQPSKYSKKLVLSIGAPSSPLISNFCMYLFDVQISEYCHDNGIKYTRYADDLSFSTDQKTLLFDLPVKVEKILQELYGGRIAINAFKTVFSSKKHNRHITGVTVTNDAMLSIGRKKKRYIKGLVYKFTNSEISESDLSYLRGYLSFVQHIEPQFLNALERKYSGKTLANLRSGSNNG